MKEREKLVKEAWETNMTIFDFTSDESLEESIRMARDAGVPEERILHDLDELAEFMTE